MKPPPHFFCPGYTSVSSPLLPPSLPTALLEIVMLSLLYKVLKESKSMGRSLNVKKHNDSIKESESTNM